MDVHLEVFSHNQTETVLSLLRLPPMLVQPYKPRTSATERNGWQVVKHRSIKVEEYLEDAGWAKHNHITVTSRTRSTLKTALPYKLVRACQDVWVSPTNSLWFLAAAWPAAQITKHVKTFIGQRGREYFLKSNNVGMYPTYVSTHLRYELLGDEANFDQWFFERLGEGMEGGALACADYVSASFDPKATSHSGVGGNAHFDLGRCPKAFPMLGELVDGLHPIIVASLKTGRALRELLGDTVQLREVRSQSTTRRGVLAIPRSVVLEHQRGNAIRRWLVPRDETTVSQGWRGEAKGEFFLAGQPCYTSRRYQELLSEDKIPMPEIPGSPVWGLLVQARYCEMMGVNPEDMLVVRRYESTQRECQDRIDACFSALPAVTPVEERIWEAHRAIWGEQYNFGEFIVFVGKRYFGLE